MSLFGVCFTKALGRKLEGEGVLLLRAWEGTWFEVQGFRSFDAILSGPAIKLLL